MAFPPSQPIDFVEEDYIGFYNRAGDAPGAQFWINQLTHNTTLGIAVGFAVSSESLAIYPYLSAPAVIDPTSYIAQIYTNVLGRAPDAAGQTFWTNRLAALNTLYTGPGNTVQNLPPGTNLPNPNVDPRVVAAAEVLTEMLQSVNMQTGTADANLMANRITVAEDYTTRTGAANVPFSQASSHAVITATTSDSASVTTAEAITTNYITNPVQTVTNLTTSVDNLQLSGANNNIVGTFNGTGATYTVGDTVVGSVAGNTLTLADLSTGGTGNPTAISTTVSGVSNIVVNSGEALIVNTATGFTGATQLTVNATGGAAITAAGTTNVTVTDAAAAAATDSVQGGKNITLTANGVTAAGTISVGTTTAPTGTVSVTENMLATQTGAKTADAINVTGGTTVTINANLNEAGGTGNTVTGGAIAVNGNASTTTVTVNQTAAATAAAAVVGTTGVVGVTGVAAAPGINGVTGVTGVAATATKAAVAGVVDGAVTIIDGNANASGNTIASVTLANYGAGSAITSNALNTLSLSGTAGTLTLNRTVANASNTLALTLNGLSAAAQNGGNDTITDTNAEITTLNVTTAGKDSTLTAFADTGLKTLNISGTNVLSLGGIAANTALTSIAVSGSAGFSGDISALGAAVALTTTSSGTITATLDSTKQTFAGSTGQDIITISADATKAITGGSGSTDEIILTGTLGNYTAAKTGANVTGFEVVGTTGASVGTLDMSQLGASIKAIDVQAGGFATFTKVTAGTALGFSGGQAGLTTYQTSDATGAADAVTVTIGTSKTTTGLTIAALTLQDANNVGLGTVNVVSNDTGFNDSNIITTLTDNGLSTLNVSGTGGLTIGALNEASTQATSFTINNTETNAAGVSIGTFTDANLGGLTFTGSNASSIGTLAGLTGKVLTISNTGTSSATIGAIASDANLQTLTLNGNVAIGTNDGTANPNAQGDVVNGITVNGSTDNAHVNLTFTGANAGATDTITLGNANNQITDNSTAGTVKVTVGTGDNLIDVHTGNANTYSATVTLGSHTDTATAFDQINVSHTNGQTSGFSASITGAVAGDHVVFTDASATTVLTLSGAQQNAITAAANLTGAITLAFADSTAAHQALSFAYGGDTYVIDNVGADTAFTAGTDTVVKLVGVHTIAANATVGHIVVAS